MTNHETQVTDSRWLFALWLLAAALMLAAVHPAATAQAAAATTQAQSSSDAGVTVKVTPKALGTADGRWEFSIVLDTHSADLSDDLMQIAVLVTDDGRTLQPSNWTGAAPGGHHREVVLSFDVPAPRPAAIELRIARPGEALPRTFRWTL